MNLIMAGIDHKTAGMEIRERFFLPKSRVGQALEKIKNASGIVGSVLLSTCNRTELYLSVEEGATVNPVEVLCEVFGYTTTDYSGCFSVRENDVLISHLMMVSTGLRSQIRGEDQIIAQVVEAAELARDVGATDPLLEALFRNAVTAGKKAKTNVPLSALPVSVSGYAVEAIKRTAGKSLKGSTALVIGNGQMGRMTAQLLVNAGCQVTVTLRSYKRGVTIVPKGCGTIDYCDRYSVMGGVDILVSATVSPHYTITTQKLVAAGRVPSYIVDLSVPRDVEPSTCQLPGVSYWNVDTLVTGDKKVDREKLMEIREIINGYKAKFYSWHSYREGLKARKIDNF